MIRKSMFAMLGGAAFAVVLSLAVPAGATCYGQCQAVIDHYWFAGCDVILDCYGPCDNPTGPCCTVVGAVCYYTEGPPLTDPNIAE